LSSGSPVTVALWWCYFHRAESLASIAEPDDEAGAVVDELASPTPR